MKRWLPRFFWGAAGAAMPTDEADAGGVYLGLEWGHTYFEWMIVRRGRPWR